MFIFMVFFFDLNFCTILGILGNFKQFWNILQNFGQFWIQF